MFAPLSSVRAFSITFRVRGLRGYAAAASAASHLVTPKQASTMLGSSDVLFVDIRDPRAYQQGHIEKSVNMIEFFSYLALSTPQGVSHLTRTFEKLLREKGVTGKEHIVCYEDSLRGMYGASCRGWYLLKRLGHPHVSVLDGGWQRWLREGHPVSVEREEPRPEGSFAPRFDPRQWVDLETVRGVINGSNTGIKLLDVRDKVEWDGLSSSPYGVNFVPRMGRLPGARHIEWYDFMEKRDEDDDEHDELDVAGFKTPEQIREIMAAKGFTPEDKIVLYCFKGARAANSLSALELAGFRNVGVYFASWNEWARQKDLKIDDAKYS